MKAQILKLPLCLSPSRSLIPQTTDKPRQSFAENGPDLVVKSLVELPRILSED